MSDPIETLLDLASKIEDWPQDVSGRDAVKTIRAATEALEVQLGETNEALAACQSEGQGWKRSAEESQARLAEAERLLQWVDDQGRMDAHDVFDFREMHAKYRAKATNSADARESAV